MDIVDQQAGNVKYPDILYNRKIRHVPIFTLQGDPFVLDLSDRSPLLKNIDPRNPSALQKVLEQRMQPRCSWALGGYLERRNYLLQHYPQIVSEKRFYHLGLDIVVPVGTVVHAPLDADVANTGYEEGAGNYGGYVLLAHKFDRCEPFYSFFGHLSVDVLPGNGIRLTAGEGFARIGDFHENGNRYHHTHLQVITKKGLAEGYLHKGYCTEKDLPHICELCPDPLPLLTVYPQPSCVRLR